MAKTSLYNMGAMTSDPLVPPLPPPVPVQPAGVPPVPVPVVPLPPGEVGDALARHYTAAARSRRPGVITTIGVTSIVVACVSVVMSLILGLQAYGMYMATLVIGTVATSAPRGMQTAAAAPVVVEEVDGLMPASSTGLSPADRAPLIAALDQRHPMTPSQRRQLEAILSTSGQELGLGNVTESGKMPEDLSGLPGPEYFVTEKGRLEIYPDRAVFFPISGAATIRVSAGPSSGGTAPSTMPAATGPLADRAPSGLTKAEIQAAVQQAQKLSGNALNPAQVQALTNMLYSFGFAKRGQTQPAITYAAVNSDGSASISFQKIGVVLGSDGRQLAGYTDLTSPPTAAPVGAQAAGPVGPPLSTPEIQAVARQAQAISGNQLTAAQVKALEAQLAVPGQGLVPRERAGIGATMVDVAADGSATIYFTGSEIALAPDGQVLRLNIVTAPMFMPAPTMSLEALTMLIVSVLLSIALAVLLLSAGIMTLRQSPKSRRLHLVYAVLKIPVAIASGLAVVWMIDSFATGVSTSPQGAGNLARWWGLGPAAVACLYPLILLVVLNTRSVREYFASVPMRMR